MSVATLAFFFRISDARFGGTYMALLNTVSNLGMVWSASIGLKVMDFLTFSKCSNNFQYNCSTVELKNVRLFLTRTNYMNFIMMIYPNRF